MKMLCDHCGKANLRNRKKVYHYTESGLPGIYLKNVTWSECPACHAREVTLPGVGRLHRCIAWRIVTKSSMLTGEEIVFLRKMLRKNQKQMAELLGLSQVVLNRWETGARQGHATANDSKIRLIYLTMQQDEYTRRINQEIWELLHRRFGKVRKESAPVKLRIDPAVCSPEETASVEIEQMMNDAIAKQKLTAVSHAPGLHPSA
jgi:putative zinc finger/helix-turn-helix YgiT family protein